MTRICICLLTLFFSLSSPIMEGNADFWRSSLAAKTGTGFIDPSKVRFTQDNIGALFRNGQSIDDVARTLRGPGGADLARSFEPIRLVERDGLLWTLDNRRLAAFSAGGQQVPFRMATQAEISAEWARKFTTTAQEGWGQFITVRPPPGFAP
jgi:hypothetical protein